MDRDEPEAGMSRAKYKDVILETIDQLRKRKARPDLERICHMVERRHGLTFEETEADLEKLVDSEIVIKVDYKGSTSYRNAAKWRKSHLGGNVLNSNDASRKLQTVVSALTQAKLKGPQEAIEERWGVSVNEIEKGLLEEDTSTNLVESHLQLTLNREVEAGRLEKLPSGNYVIADPKTSSPKSKPTSPGTPDKADSTPSKGRPATKRKIRSKNLKENKIKRSQPVETDGMEISRKERLQVKEKDRKDKEREDKGKTEEESEIVAAAKGAPSPQTHPPAVQLQQPPLKQMAPGNMYEETEARCDYCLLTSECNRNGQAENLLFCKDCQAKAHPSCMDYSEDLAKRARNSPWQCIDCKTCYVCEDSGDPDAMLFCDACDKGYHMNCHNPQIEEKPTGKWVCSKCILELGLDSEAMDSTECHGTEVNQTNSQGNNNNTSNINNNTESGGASCLPTPSDSPVHFQDAPVQLPNPIPDQKEPKHSSLTGKMPNGHIPTPTIPRLADTLPAEVPDASEWTIEDVVQFFKDVGFIDQADVFREQEIDGRSLLLMKRSDVLTGLSLKLGPALKIYTHVQRLQMRGDMVM